ncbi:protein of unknown function [Pseudomonas sp. JV241A]|nr:protein of unknown function [Pseudomonas sp. JV241A]
MKLSFVRILIYENFGLCKPPR